MQWAARHPSPRKSSGRRPTISVAVKGNQEFLLDDIKDTFAHSTAPSTMHTATEISHGRIEKRNCTITRDLSFICKAGQWDGLAVLARINITRTHKTTGEKQQLCYYITSITDTSADLMSERVRQHWGHRKQAALDTRCGFQGRP